MARLEPTRALAMKVWWAFIWRTFLGVFVVAFVIGVAIGMLGAIGLGRGVIEVLLRLLAVAIGVGVSIEAMYRILRKRFVGFELALISTEPQQ